MKRKTNKTSKTDLVEPRPGEWADIEVIEISGSDSSECKNMKQKYREDIESGKIKPEYSDELMAQYDFVRKNITDPENVFYPCCSFDATPIKAFPNSRVTLMDKDKDAQIVMQNAGIESFIFGDIKQHSPENPYDLVIILNPQIKSKDLTKHLVKGGHVIANNYHDNAGELLEDKDFNGIGTIDYDNEKGLYLAKNFDKLEPHQWKNYFYVFERIKS